MRQPRIAVVIPTLNEGPWLRRILPPLADIADRIVVSDGGSVDDTVAVAHRNRAQVVVGPKGRGLQLNKGATASEADAYVFLHADTELPAGALPAIRGALDDGFVGGGFFVTFDSPRPVFRFGSRMINLRTRLTRLPLGDQAQFASSAAFKSIGGFKAWPILEDLDFIRRLRRTGPLTVLSPPVTTSARRFELNGPVRTLATNWLIFALFAIGVSPHALQRLYREPVDGGREKDAAH